MNDKITALKEQMGGMKARFFQRDSDTLLEWDNHGVLFFKLFHEWNDSYNPATDETGTIVGETYNSASDSFSVATTTGQPVFNGRLSGLWDLVSTACPNEVAAMYQAMRSAGFNFETLWALYQKFKGQWCEALYAADAMGYANTGRFDMAYGDKSEAVRAILKKRFRYLDSKYGANTAHSVVLRLWGNGHGVVLRHYCPIYASLNWGAGDVQRIRSIVPGEPSHFENPGVTFNDTTVTIYDADLITEIASYVTLPDGTRQEGGLQALGSALMFSQGLDQCKRLRSFVLDYGGGEPNMMADNKTLQACDSVALRKMVVRNCPNVSGHPVFKSQVIEEIDFRQTPISGLTVPSTDTLKSMRLGSAIQSLALDGYGSLDTLTFESVDKLTALSIRDCPKLNGRATLEEALGNGVIESVSMLGVNWRNFDPKYLMVLAELRANITGTIILPEAANMSFALKQKCLEAWGNVDDQLNPLYIGYTQRPVEIIRISGAGYFSEVGEYQLSVVSDDPYANDFTKIEWSMTANNYADIDTLTGRVTVNRVGTAENAPSAEVTVTITKSDGTTVSKTTVIGFYEREAHPGDYVYADGTYSDVYDEGKTVVAICWYVDPADRTRRLGVAPRFVYGQCAWGCEAALTLSDAANAGLVTNNVVQIPDTWFNSNSPAETNFIDESMPDGIKALPSSGLLRGGFVVAPISIGAIEEGQLVPFGMLETAYILKLRNTILRDSGINLVVPAKTSSETEMENFKRLLAAANTTPGGGYRYYFPAASAAYAYEPAVKDGETLNPKFKAHNWFLPTPGDAQMMISLSRVGALASIRSLGVFTAAGWLHTTGEYSKAGYCYKPNLTSGEVLYAGNDGYDKYKANASVLPMVAF